MKTVKITTKGQLETLFLEKELLLKDKLMSTLISSQDIMFNKFLKTRGDNSKTDFDNLVNNATIKLNNAFNELVDRFDLNEKGEMKDPYTTYKLKDAIDKSYEETTVEGTKKITIKCENIALRKSELKLVDVKGDTISIKNEQLVHKTFYRIIEDKYNAQKISFRPVHCLTLETEEQSTKSSATVFANFRKRVTAKL